MTDTPPPVEISDSRGFRFDAVSVVWLVPLVALVVAAVIGWRAYVDRGPVIEIRFESASGIVAGQTELRFRDVPVGLVEDVQFTTGLAEVAVFVRLNQDVAQYVDADAAFWIVRPQVSAQGISGLDTVFSGVYIEGFWDDEIGAEQQLFLGQTEPALVSLDQRGLRIELRATGDMSLTERTPILFKGIEVGQIGSSRITRDGSAVVADAIIFEQYEQLVTTTTRFWDTSGFSLTIGAGGASLDFGSIASIVSGGITFETLISGARPVSDGVVFQVYADEGAARASVFEQPDGTPLLVSVVFEENVAGLTIGAPVELGGIRIGQVSTLTGIVDPLQFGDQRVRLLTSLAIQPSRLGLQGDATPSAALDFLSDRVEAGLRARLATASIFTGGLKVELVDDEDAPFATIDRDNIPFPRFPSTENDIEDLTASAQGVLERVGNLPIEELLENAIVFLDTATSLVGNEDTQAVPGDVRALLQDARNLVGSDSAQAVPDALASALTEFDLLVKALNEQEAATRLLSAVTALETVAGDVSVAIDGVPDLIDSIETVAVKVEGLAVEELVAELSSLADSANAVIGTEVARAVPEQLSASLSELQALLTDLNEQDAADQLLAAFGAVETAAADFGAAIEGVPDLVQRIDTVAATAADLPLEDLATELTDLVASAEKVIDTDAARDLPESLGTALDELGQVLAELREGGVTENLNETLASARSAADKIAASAEDLPALVERLSATLAQANATLASFDRGSDLNRDARSALRAVQSAAEDVSSLARTIERQPNALITGR